MTLYQDDTDSFFEDFEAEDMDERARSGRGGRGGYRGQGLNSVPNGSSMPRRGSGAAVTEAMLNAAVSKLDGKIEAVNKNTKTLELRTNSLAGEQDRQSAALKKENSERRKEAEAIKRDLRQTRELSAILPLLSQPSSVMVNTPQVDATGKVVLDAGGHEVLTPVKVLSGTTNTLSTLLPLMLMMGSGSGSGDSGSGGAFGGGDNSMMLMMAVLLSANK